MGHFLSRRLAFDLCVFSSALGFACLLTACSGGPSNSGGTTIVQTAVPSISSISPTKLAAGSSALTLTVSGSNFLSTSAVSVGGASEVTTYVNSSQLTATVPAAQLVSGAQLAVTVSNGGSASSASVGLEVDNPAPAISSISTTSVLAGTASAIITVTGTGFVPTTVINVNGSARATTYINSTQVSVALPSTDFTAAGTLSVTAVNPTPAGGTSGATSITVTNPPVGAIRLSPSSLAAGSTSAATVTVTGTGFIAASTVQVGGTARPTTFVSNTALTFTATVADQATAGTLPITVSNPAPGGGTSAVVYLSIVVPPATPVITSVSPASIVAGSTATSLTVMGTGFTTATVVQWNGTNLPTSFTYVYSGSTYTLALLATVPAASLTTTGTATITANTPLANPSTSNAVNVSIVNPPVPSLTSLSPAGGAIATASAETLVGTGFTTNTTVAINGQTIPSTFVSSTQITATFPASALATPGNQSVTVTTPSPGGGTSASLLYTTFISIANNDIVFNAADGMIYASVPAATLTDIGNAVVAIDPNTGAVVRTIQVGTNPNKLAISSDGTQLFVGIDGAGAVAQVNLAQGKIVNQFSLGGGNGVYNPPLTAAYLAAVPGLPNSVAVAYAGYYSGSGVTIFDSGVARTGKSVSVGAGPLSFGASPSSLYVGSSYIYSLAIDSTGVSKSTQLASVSSTPTALQYDAGALYISNGQVLDSSSGALKGTFYSAGTTQASGPVVSDSSLGRAFMALSSFSNYYNSNAVYVFDESSYTLLGTIPVNALGTGGYSTSFRKIVRWGQNGIAISAVPSSFTSSNQIFILQSPLVKDVSSSPADLSVALTVPSTASTGTAISYTAKITNGGPNAAVGAALSASLDPSLIINSVTTSQGACNSAALIACDLGSIASGGSATVTVSAIPTTAGTLSATASITSSSYDATPTNNQATASTTVTGSFFGASPLISSISPNFVQAGAAAFTLTVKGTGFSSSSTVNLGATPLATTFVSSTQLTASVAAAQIANYGWASVTVSNPAPGGGISAVVPLTIYSLVNVTPNSILFDPYGQSLYATIPSNSTGVTGNSIVAINPFTGAIGTPVPVGSQPTVMSETSNGNYVYIGLSGAASLAKFSLINQSVAATIPLNYGSTKTTAASLTTMPGSESTLAVGISNGYSFGIFDVNGSTGSFRPNVSGIYDGTNPVFASPTSLYAYDNQTTGAEFYRYNVNASGVTLQDGTTLNGLGGFTGGIQVAGNLVYGYGGGIVNPFTTPPSQIQTLPMVDFTGSGDTNPGVAVTPDLSLGKEFIVEGNGAVGLVRYDLNSYLPEAVLPTPSAASGVYSNWTMQRFGQDGLAMLSYNNFGQTTPVIQLLLLRGPFVAPQELSTATSTSATLTSSSASTIPHASGNLVLTLTGSNFLPGMAVTWNGSYRTTTILDATHATIAVPASDLASAGTASVVATNINAPASNTLSVTIN